MAIAIAISLLSCCQHILAMPAAAAAAAAAGAAPGVPISPGPARVVDALLFAQIGMS